MPILRNMTIKRKLTSIIMLTCIAALLLAGMVFIVWQWTSFRHTMARNLSIQAEMTADNCKAALAFEDTKDAEDILKALHAQPSIVLGCVNTKNGEEFASYYRDDIDSSIHPSKLQKDGYSFDDSFLTVFKSIVLDGEKIGTVCLRSNLQPLYAMLKRNVVMGVAILLSALLAAYFVSSGLQRIISGPILSLAEVTKLVSEKKDYSARAIKQSNDEVGLLIDGFNEMLEQIQQRDSALIGTKEQLEIKVKERTSELSSTNMKLAEEVAERSSAQRRLKQHIKQLNCFYGLSKLVEQPKISLEQIFQKTTDLIRNTYKNPDITCVKITFNGIQYQTSNFKKSNSSQCASIRRNEGQVGNIEVYYLGENIQEGKVPFLKEEHDLLIAIAEHLGSIAERRYTTEKLQLFRNLMEKSNDSVFVISPQWSRFLDVNNRACENLGYTREELLSMTFKDIEQSIPDDSSWQENLRELKSQEDIIIQGQYIHKDTTTSFTETSLRYVSQKGKDYVIAVARDITERKKAEEKQAHLLEQLKNVNKELKDFAYVASHDLKAPLRGISTLAEWISADYADKLDEDGKEQLNLLMVRVDRMRNLINGILQYSRVGRIKENKSLVNLDELVPEIIDTLAPPENITITIEDKMPTIECEQTRIIQLFQNLVSNAIKYMDKPEGRIRVGCIEENDCWKFHVSDNGPGIEEKYFEKVFQIFQTLSPRDEVESTGVGLAVVKKIIDTYGGRLWVESEPGKGTSFLFTLPKKEMGVKNAKFEADIAC